MRSLLSIVVAAGLLAAGCEQVPKSGSTSDLTSGAKGPDMKAPEMKAPEKPAAPQVKTPDKPATPDVKAPEVKKPELKAPEAPKPVDKTPITADLSKIKFTPEGELFGWNDGESKAFFYANGLGEVAVAVPADGEYDVVFKASCQAAMNQNAKFQVKVDGKEAGQPVTLTAEDAKEYSVRTELKAGERKIGAEFLNDLYKENEYDLNFYLEGLKIVRVK